MSTVPSATTTTTAEAMTSGRPDDRQQPTVHQRFDVTGMTCSHCEHAIAAELSTVHGVVSVEVDARTGIVMLGCFTEPDPAAVAAAIHDAGYDLR
jgi:copper chaperone